MWGIPRNRAIESGKSGRMPDLLGFFSTPTLKHPDPARNDFRSKRIQANPPSPSKQIMIIDDACSNSL
jgi:hypothetical protein